MTDCGIVIWIKEEHPANALSPMVWIDDDRTMSESETQPSNDKTPIDVTEGGIVTRLSDLQPLNA